MGKIEVHKGYIRRTLKETNPDRALVLAEQAYENQRVREKGGLSLMELSVDKFFNEWIQTQKIVLQIVVISGSSRFMSVMSLGL